MDTDNFFNRTGPRNRHPDILAPGIGRENELLRAPSPDINENGAYWSNRLSPSRMLRSSSTSTSSSRQEQKTPTANKQQTPEATQPPPTSSPTLCAICLSIPPFSPKAILVHPCLHEFCLKCIQGWIKVQRKRASVQASKCPICRGVIRKIVEKNGRVVEDLTDEVPDEKERRRRELVRAAAEHRRVQARASLSDGMWFW